MATITTDTYLDGGTARTAGETWSLNGATLTVRTDTRVHANAPASMTGTLGTLTVSSALGGSLYVDGSKVRWMAFDTGSGNVPAIGTSITQGGVSGYLLGVWADIQSAPTTAGSAMPASGFIKFREVTGGAFSAGALTGISANASSPDVRGWIEFVMDSTSSITGNELGNGIIFNGDWFYLDNTNGSIGQQIKTPTNGGGSGTTMVGVQIETSPGSGVYEWYPAVAAASQTSTWNTTNIGTDARSKFVEAMANGVIRIGSDGTNNVGYVPASGCKVRIPNILFRSATSAARATNIAPGTASTNIAGGNNKVVGAHIEVNIAAMPKQCYFENSIIGSVVSTSNAITPAVIKNSLIGGLKNYGQQTLNVLASNNITVENVKVAGIGYTTGTAIFSNCQNASITNLEVVAYKVRAAVNTGVSFSLMSNLTINGLKIKAVGGATLTTCANSSISNVDYCDRIEANTNSTNSADLFTLTNCQNIVFNGGSFGEGGTIAEAHPYGYVFNLVSCNNVKIRNWGTRSNPLNTYTANCPIYFHSVDTNCINMKIQRCFITKCRNGFSSMNSNNRIGVFFEDCGETTATTHYPSNVGYNAVVRKMALPSPTAFGTANVGVHWLDSFPNDTTGAIWWYPQVPSAETQDKNYIVSTPAQGTAYLASAAAVSLDTQNDYVFSESGWQFLGHTSFQNSTPVLSGTTTGMVAYYDLDTGSGFSGTWKQATGANLSAETISPAGFKMRVKVVQTGTGNTATSLTGIKFLTNSTLSAQSTYQYPLDTNTLTFTGLAVGSEVRCYVGTDPATATEIGGTESSGSSTFSFTHSSGGSDGYIMILAMGYQPIRIPYTYKSSDDSILIQPVIDRNYNNPA